MFIGFGDTGKRPRTNADEVIDSGWTDKDLVKGLTHLYGMMGRAQEQAEKQNNLPCKAGCSWCCENRTVLLTHAEWMLVLQYMKAADPKIVRHVLRKALIEYKKNKAILEHIASEQEQADAWAEKIETPCPMLVNGLCSIYEARPHDCRMYGCSFQGDDLYACHLVLDAVANKPTTLPAYEASYQLLQLYPRTDLRQPFAYWVKHHLPEALRDLALSETPPT